MSCLLYISIFMYMIMNKKIVGYVYNKILTVIVFSSGTMNGLTPTFHIFKMSIYFLCN